MSDRFKIRVFRAIEDRDACLRNVKGHQAVLEQFNLAYIASADEKWMNDPNVYVIITEDLDTSEVLAGARIHVAAKESMLPLAEGLSPICDNIHDLVDSYAKNGTAEFCGLWNSMKVAGYGVGSRILGRVGVARVGVTIASYLNLESMFALCAKYTVNNALKLGFVPEEKVGDNGKFIYPLPAIPVSLLVHKDPLKLKQTREEEREFIFNLREKPNQLIKEKGPKGEVVIEYDLNIASSQFY